jgi:hypothetical protein
VAIGDNGLLRDFTFEAVRLTGRVREATYLGFRVVLRTVYMPSFDVFESNSEILPDFLG